MHAKDTMDLVGEMTISYPSGGSPGTFVVSALDWVANGLLESDTSGYYDWIIDDGRTGKTPFPGEPNGSLHCKGRGIGNEINWEWGAPPGGSAGPPPQQAPPPPPPPPPTQPNPTLTTQ